MRDPSNYRRLFRLRLGGKGRVDREMDEEIESHLQMHIDDLISRGMSPEDARRAATGRFGDLEEARNRLRAGARRREATLRQRDWLGALAADVRFALRQARRSPGFTALVLLTLSLGIGLTTGTFTLVHGVLLRPLPFVDPDRLVSLTSRDSLGNDVMTVSAGNWIDWRRGSRLLDGTALHFPESIGIGTDDGAIRVSGSYVSGNFFDVLRTRFIAGRPFTEDDAKRHARVAVVSEGLWRRVLGADASLARPLSVGGNDYAVVGVVAGSHEFPEETELWLAQDFAPESGAMRNNINWFAIGRLRKGATVEQARTELDRIALAIHRQEPLALYSYGVGVRSLHDAMVGDASQYLRLLMLAVTAVLLIGSANLAAANLARSATRGRELAVRAALGAGRGRIVRQLLVEQVVLSLVGGVLGTWLAWGGVRILLRTWAAQIPRATEIRLDPVTLAFAVGVSLAAGIAAGLAPALRGSRVHLQGALASGARAVRGGRNVPGALLVTGEIALALVLLTSAGLLLRSFRLLLSRELGFDVHAVTAKATLPQRRYPDSLRAVAYWEQVQDALREIPGVTSVGVANWTPLSMAGAGFIEIGGRDVPGAGAGYRAVSEDYFRALGVPLLAGRTFGAGDGAGAARVAIINRKMAEMYWPGSDPIGRTMRALSQEGFNPRTPAPWLTVVGVVGNVRQWGLEGEIMPEMYVDFRQVANRAYAMTAVVAGSSATDRLRAQVRERFKAIDPSVAVEVETFDVRLRRSLANRRFTMIILSGFGGLALTLAAIGLYALLSYAVAQRTRELAVRAAIGATRSQLLGMVFGGAMRLVLTGAAVGITVAVWVSRAMQALLVDIRPLDPQSFVGATAALIAVAVLAILVPAVRATRLDPLLALRSD